MPGRPALTIIEVHIFEQSCRAAIDFLKFVRFITDRDVALVNIPPENEPKILNNN